LGYEPHYCQSEAEAKAFFSHPSSLVPHPSKYPVFFFESDTSGEKSFEEFFTEDEELDMERFEALGVITNAPRQELSNIDKMFEQLRQLFASDHLTKDDIVELMQAFIPNFAHIETGKSLDAKM
jgi:hypothetical protein